MMGWMAPLRHLSAKLLSDRSSSEWEPSMGEVTTIGLDLAKHVFQVHGVDAEGATVLRYQAAPLAMMWNTNPSTVIPTATAAIGSRTSTVAFAPFTGPVKVSKSPTAQSRKLR
jgi:hypothetical protein